MLAWVRKHSGPTRLTLWVQISSVPPPNPREPGASEEGAAAGIGEPGRRTLHHPSHSGAPLPASVTFPAASGGGGRTPLSPYSRARGVRRGKRKPRERKGGEASTTEGCPQNRDRGKDEAAGTHTPPTPYPTPPELRAAGYPRSAPGAQ